MTLLLSLILNIVGYDSYQAHEDRENLVSEKWWNPKITKGHLNSALDVNFWYSTYKRIRFHPKIFIPFDEKRFQLLNSNSRSINNELAPVDSNLSSQEASLFQCEALQSWGTVPSRFSNVPVLPPMTETEVRSLAFFSSSDSIDLSADGESLASKSFHGDIHYSAQAERAMTCGIYAFLSLTQEMGLGQDIYSAYKLNTHQDLDGFAWLKLGQYSQGDFANGLYLAELKELGNDILKSVEGQNYSLRKGELACVKPETFNDYYPHGVILLGSGHFVHVLEYDQDKQKFIIYDSIGEDGQNNIREINNLDEFKVGLRGILYPVKQKKQTEEIYARSE